jgi:predicted enzyme related to lactoylglutathione lyase
MIDRIEAGGRESPRIRVAFEVDDADGTTRRLEAAGATVIAEPIETPWHSRNSRLERPADLTLTLFEEQGGEEHFLPVG